MDEYFFDIHSQNAVAVSILEAMYLKGLYGSFLGSANGSAGRATVAASTGAVINKIARVRTDSEKNDRVRAIIALLAW